MHNMQSFDTPCVSSGQVSPPTLRGFLLQLTPHCNSRCIFCFNSNRINTGVLDVSAYKGVLTSLAAQRSDHVDLANVAITGGEPLLEADKVLELARFHKGYGISTRLVSNGILLTQDYATDLWESGVTSARISLDASTAQKYEAIRGISGAFEKVLSGLGCLLNAGIYTITRYTLNTLNLDDVLETYKLANSLGVDEFQIRVVFPYGGGNIDMMPNLEVVESVYRDLFGAESTTKVTTPCFFYGPCTNARIDYRITPCPCARAWLYITSDGSIWPCQSFPESCNLGNFFTDDISRVWTTSALLSELRNTIPPECRTCAYWERCFNQCHGLVYGFTGRFDQTCYSSLRQALGRK